MALSEREKQIVEYGKQQGKSDLDIMNAISKDRATQKDRGTFEKVKDIAIGAGKGFLQSGFETQKMLQSVGLPGVPGLNSQFFQQNVEPTIDKALEAKNKDQQIGKYGEFAVELLFPAGGSKKGGAVLENIVERAKSIPDANIKGRLIDLASKLDDKTKTALQRTPQQLFEEFVDIGKRAVTDDREVTPIEYVGKKFVEGAKKVKETMQGVGRQKQIMINRTEVGEKPVGSIVDKAIGQITQHFQSMKLDESDRNFVGKIIGELKKVATKSGIENSERIYIPPKLRDVDSTLDLIQEMIFKSGLDKAVPITDRVTGPLRGILGELNTALKKVGGKEYSKLNDQYSDLLQTLNNVNRKVGKKGERAGAFMKQFFSPSDAGSKELFDKMEKLTGIDFSRDARLAKFVMESLGDKRVESLLEQIPKIPGSPTELFMKVGQAIADKMGINDPIEAARRFLESKGDDIINKMPTPKTTTKEIAALSDDEVIDSIKELKVNDLFKRGKLNLEVFEELQELSTKLEERTLSPEEIKKAREILRLAS